jgi:hypothetical protein
MPKTENLMPEIEVVDYICKEFSDRVEKKSAIELNWNFNVNFLSGNQYCDVDYLGNRIFSIEKLYDYQERVVYNNIAPIIETRMAKLSSVVPELGAITGSSDIKEVLNAKISTAVLKSTFKSIGFSNKIKQALAICETVGTVFYKTIWDKYSGEIVAKKDGEEIRTGDVHTDVCSPYEIFPDSLYIEDISEQRSIIHAKPYHIEKIKDIWNVELEPYTVNMFSLTNVSNVTGGLGWTGSAQTVSSDKKDNYDIILEYYEKPTKKYKNGRFIVVAYYNKKLIYSGEMPYQNECHSKIGYPFVKQVAINKPGCFFGMSVIERLIPIQRDYNAIQNRINEYLNRAALGIPIVEDGSVDIDNLEYYGMPPGMPLVYSRGSEPPRFMDTPALPYSFMAKQDKLEQAFISISGISELSRASQTSRNITSGTALSVLAQQDETRLSITAENIRTAVLETGKQWLRLYRQFATFKRMLTLGGDDLDNAAVAWKNDNLLPESLELTTQNEIENSLSTKRELIGELYSMGIFSDSKTGKLSKPAKTKILSMLKMGDWENSLELDNLNSARAIRGNFKMKDKKICEIRELDDHTIHIEEHTKYILTNEFEELEIKDKTMSKIFLEHINLHKTKIEE